MTQNGNTPETANAPEEAVDNIENEEMTGEIEMTPLEAAEAEIADLKDRLLRAMADEQNLRRRLEREKSEATLYAATRFARDLLSVADNMTRALESVTPQEREQASEPMKNLLAGIELTSRELENAFARNNIKKINPMGEKFDPNLHQAMFEVPDPEQVNGTVVQVVQPGYTIGERVLRPAMVGVAKSDKKAPADQGQGQDQG